MYFRSFKLAALLVAVCAASPVLAQGPQAQHVQPASHHAGQQHAGYLQYPQLQAPMYPSPVQHTPAWNGGTVVTNQAFAPHEMLYPHTYRAMYAPYYYRVKGGWIWTPFGMRQHEQVKLEGTEVVVKYKSHYPLFSGFTKPRTDGSLMNCFFNK